ncbi:MAG: hypothetical protein JNL85_07725 [Rubrivivax sp.]|nr:hypothetical protein [Rubrivivax sp.]
MTDETPLEPRHFEAALRLVPGAAAPVAAGATSGAGAAPDPAAGAAARFAAAAGGSAAGSAAGGTNGRTSGSTNGGTSGSANGSTSGSASGSTSGSTSGSANGSVASTSLPPPQGGAVRPLPERVAELEQQALAEALAATRGNRVAAARLLGISRAAFYDKLARWPEIDKRLR